MSSDMLMLVIEPEVITKAYNKNMILSKYLTVIYPLPLADKLALGIRAIL